MSDDDDFGDFEDFAQAAPFETQPSFTATSTPPLASPGLDSALSREFIASMQAIFSGHANDVPGELCRVAKEISGGIGEDQEMPPPVGEKISVIVEEVPEVPVRSQFTNTEQPSTVRRIKPNPIHPTDAWAVFINQLATDASYMQSMTNSFRWRTSATRSILLNALGIDKADESTKNELKTEGNPVNPNKKGAFESIVSTCVVAEVSEETRERSLSDARAFCHIPEDELLKKTPEQLKEISETLHELSRKMQEQAAYWLDAKEQLVMDAEMHNKMIASLVSYAQQQQIASKSTTLTKKSKHNKH